MSIPISLYKNFWKNDNCKENKWNLRTNNQVKEKWIILKQINLLEGNFTNTTPSYKIMLRTKKIRESNIISTDIKCTMRFNY